jgi:fermentation-respiration switch protein FrsA (DUF1100 family)
MQRLATGLVAVVAIVLAIGALVYLVQRSVLFPAPPSASVFRAGSVEIVRLPHAGGHVEGLFLPATADTGTAADGRRPLLVFFHGNGELADYWVTEFDTPRAWGWSVLLVEYPGYGRSAGSPSEGSITETSRAAHGWAQADERVDATRIVAYGRSVGGGPAARLAADATLPALILESSFTSVRPLAARMGVPGFLVRDPFDNLAALRGFRGRVLVIHGRDDTLIPVSHGRQLAAAVPGAELHELPCGHNDCPRPWEIIERFLRAVR